jgi:predicted dehydrogenase
VVCPLFPQSLSYTSYMDSRRIFLGKVASGLGSLAAVPARVLGANDRIRVGFIGFGDRGTDLLNHARACPNIDPVAFADIFSKQLDRAQSLIPGAAAYSDHRGLLDDPSIDAVIIATPNHLHAAQFLDALDAHKHVYVEKPMAFTVADAKQMRVAFERDGGKHTIQIGHQACSSGPMRDARMFLADPALMGKISVISMRMFRNSPRGKSPWSRARTPELSGGNLDWNAFLGSAPARDFDANRFANWRLFWDYSGGMMHDAMSQQLAFWSQAMHLQIPRAATSTGGVLIHNDGRETPDTMNVSLAQPEDLLIHWASCIGNSHPGIGEDVLGGHGTISRDQLIRYAPQKVSRPDGNEMTGRTAQPPHAHMANFFDAIRSRRETNCPFETGWRVSIAARMAIDSYRLGRTVRWDAQKEEIV